MHRMYRLFLSIAFLSAPIVHTCAQIPPRLIVVISLDQFPYEYLTRFGRNFGSGGFRYFTDSGAVFTNASYKHANTSTGPGHAVILSGTYGRMNGIITNSWYDRAEQRSVYCVEDRAARGVGAAGMGRSPRNLIGFTYGDMLRIHSGFRSTVVSLSHKDRSAILMGGKFANIALWMKDSLFATSTYYAPQLPEWVQRFNESRLITSFFGRAWESTLPPAMFRGMDTDDAPYENGGSGLGRTFPHPIRGDDSSAITSSYYSALLTSPFGNEILSALAREAVTAEHLGRGDATDLLCISFSATDYVGHAFGPQSHEVLEMAVQTDRMLAAFLTFLDKQVGLNTCILVLTSDHGVSPAPEYLAAASGRQVVHRYSNASVTAYAESVLTDHFLHSGKGAWIDRWSSAGVYFNPAVLGASGVQSETAGRVLCDALVRREGVAAAFTRDQIRAMVPGNPLEVRIRNSFHEQRSGDVVVAMQPLWVEGDAGASHGEPYEQDAHVPLCMRGPGIARGVYHTEASPVDIAPTLSVLTGVEFTPGREGRVLVEALVQRR